jgi:hypothetical protein
MATGEKRIGIKITGDNRGGKQALDGTADSAKKAKGEIKGFGDELRDLGQTNADNLVGDLRSQLAGIVGLGAAVGVIRDSIAAYRRQESAVRGVSAVAENEGVPAQQALATATGLASQGFLTFAEAAKSVQNLLGRGYSLDEATGTIRRLTDAAIDNRAAHLSVGEAVLTATEGLKNENSELVDNAGVTKNVSVIWKEYAEQIGVSVQQLTQAQKVQAEVNGILRETAAQAGAAELALQGLEGQMAAAGKAAAEFQVGLGEALAPSAGLAAGLGAALTRGLGAVVARFQASGASIARWQKELGAGLELLRTGDFEGFAAANAEAERLWNEIHDDIRESYGLTRLFTGAVEESAQAAYDLEGIWQRIAQRQRESAAAAATSARAQAEAAAKVLGVDLEELTTGISEQERKIIAAFKALSSNPAVTGEEITAAWRVALDKLSSEAVVELQKLGRALEVAGRLSGEDLTRMFEQADNRLRGLAARLELVGTQGPAAMNALRDAARGAVDAVSDLNTAMGRREENDRIFAERVDLWNRYRAGEISPAELDQGSRALDQRQRELYRARRGAGAGSPLIIGETDWQNSSQERNATDWQNSSQERNATDWQSGMRLDTTDARARVEDEFRSNPLEVPVRFTYAGRELDDAALQVGDSRA